MSMMKIGEKERKKKGLINSFMCCTTFSHLQFITSHPIGNNGLTSCIKTCD